jgi:SAM-dependent methyltransferase
LRKIAPTGRFLDVGCATGFFLQGIRQNSDWEVHGVEFSPEAAAYARSELGLAVMAGDLQEAAYPDGFFDFVHVNNVLEHVLDPAGLLNECRRILRPGGRLFLAVPNGVNDSRPLIDYHRGTGAPAFSPSGHIFFFPARTLLRLFEQLDLEVVSTRTGSIKRGLRNARILPRKRGWQAAHAVPPGAKQAKEGQGITVSEEGKKPDLYYRYRNFSAELGNLPGLHEFGLDFLFELRKEA